MFGLLQLRWSLRKGWNLFAENGSICDNGGGGSKRQEDDYLYQLDKNTGEVIDRLPLKKMPDLMAVKDDRLYVHTYSYDYVIGIF